jgi:hypothetical protein
MHRMILKCLNNTGLAVITEQGEQFDGGGVRDLSSEDPE